MRELEDKCQHIDKLKEENLHLIEKLAENENKNESYEKELSLIKTQITQMKNDFGEFENLVDFRVLVNEQRSHLKEITRHSSDLSAELQMKVKEIETLKEKLAEKEQLLESKDDVIRILNEKEAERKINKQMKDDKARSEATFRFTVPNFKNLKDSAPSPLCYVRNLPWKIKVMPRQKQKSLGFYFQCNAESESSSWSCNATAELRLIPHKPDTEPVCCKIHNQLFSSKQKCWGRLKFMRWNDLLDPEKGYIKDDSITLEVCITADAPHISS